MNAERNNKNFDELIAKAIGRDRPKFDFDQWKQTHEKEIDIFKSQDKSPKTNSVSFEPNIQRTIFLSKVGYLAAALLIIFSWASFFVMSGKVKDLKEELKLARRDIALAQQGAAAPADDSATINLYLKEHRDVVAQHASYSPGASQPTPMRVSQDDILYYEFLDEGPDYMRPGIIVRGPSSQRDIGLSETPVISNGHTLTLSEARDTADFELRAPPWLDPGFALDQIRRIDGRDTLQLLYTDGIHSVSLFEQSLDGRRGLSRQDFREYAVYRKAEQAAGTILAWKDHELAYVLIGSADMAQLMGMAQSISTGR